MIWCGMAEIEIKAVIFDLDGVLVDSESVYRAVFDRWLWEQKFSPAIREKILTQNAPGVTWEDLIRATNQIAHINFDYAQKQVILSDRIVRYILDVGIPLKPDAKKTVQRLGERYQLAVASNSLHMVIERLLRHHGLFDYFQTFTGVDDVQYGKPHPELYQKTMAQLGVQPEETVVIEDTLSGAKAGAAAGAFVYVIPDPHFSAEQFIDLGQVVPNFDRIMHELL